MNLRDKIADAVEADFYAIYRGDRSFNDTADAIFDVIAESVVPLEWVEVKFLSSWFYAKTEVGKYRCGWSHHRGFYFTMSDNDVVGLTNMKSLDAAKDATQADYTRRILSALGIWADQ